MRWRSFPHLLLAALLLSLVPDGSAAPGAGRGGPPLRSAHGLRALRVAVIEMAVVDNSYEGDSERLRQWMIEGGFEPTALLRQAVASSDTYGSLSPRPQFVTVAGSGIGAALRANGLTSSDCRSVECAVRIGRELGADRVITGEVTKLSVLIWFVTGRVIDVRTGKVLRQDEFEVKGVISDLMPKVMVVLARRFASVEGSDLRVSSPPASKRPA